MDDGPVRAQRLGDLETGGAQRVDDLVCEPRCVADGNGSVGADRPETAVASLAQAVAVRVLGDEVAEGDQVPTFSVVPSQTNSPSMPTG